MLTFLDGPAKGHPLSCSRAPMFLRVVQKPENRWDALDQLYDSPEPDETIHAYLLVENQGWVHYCGHDKNGKRFGRQEQCAAYRLFEQQPDDATARDNKLWAAWVTARGAELKAKESDQGGA